MKYVSGQILQEDRFTKGYIGFEDGMIKEVGKGSRNDAIAKGIIVPTFVNAHTHAGDAVIKEGVRGSLEELVAPGHGLKHRVLRETPAHEIVEAMRYYLDRMVEAGTGCFCDFRECGMEGLEQLNKALTGLPLKHIVLGRPKGMKYSKSEIEALLKNADGIGLSAVSDWDDYEIERIARHVNDKGKIFALHASEGSREDIDTILNLKPEFLIHMTKANDSDLDICSEEEIPIIICPRTNLFFGTVPPIKKMVEKGICLALGTDNAMINSPEIMKEIELAHKFSKAQGGVDSFEILKMVIENPRKVFNAGEHIRPRIGDVADFLVIETSAEKPAHALMTGEYSRKISLVSVGRYTWAKTMS